jgi:hypothetical protein
VEPLDADVRGRAQPYALLAAWAAAASLLVFSTGDGLAAAVLAGVAALDAWAGTVAVAAVVVGLARFGTTSLAGLAGVQAVLGPAVLVGPAVGAAASILAAAACVLAAPRGWRAWPVGALAGLVALGPAAVNPGDAAVRLGGLVLGVGLVELLGRRWPTRPAWARIGALVLAGIAVALAVAA